MAEESKAGGLNFSHMFTEVKFTVTEIIGDRDQELLHMCSQ